MEKRGRIELPAEQYTTTAPCSMFSRFASLYPCYILHRSVALRFFPFSVFRFSLCYSKHYSRPVTASVCCTSVVHRSRGFLCFPCPSMVSCARPIYAGFNPHNAWGIIDACPVTAGRSCILRADATFIAVSVLLWSYAIRCHTGRR